MKQTLKTFSQTREMNYRFKYRTWSTKLKQYHCKCIDEYMEDFTQGKITPYQVAAIFGIKNKKHVVEYMACRTQDMIKIKPRGEGDMKLLYPYTIKDWNNMTKAERQPFI